MRRGFLDEFMRKKENKELPEIKFKNRHKNKKKQNTFVCNLKLQFFQIILKLLIDKIPKFEKVNTSRKLICCK